MAVLGFSGKAPEEARQNLVFYYTIMIIQSPHGEMRMFKGIEMVINSKT
jgi:hypothetical protein